MSFGTQVDCGFKRVMVRGLVNAVPRRAASTLPILTGFGWLVRMELANQGEHVFPKPHLITVFMLCKMGSN